MWIEDIAATEFGSPSELLARPSYYARVVNGQVALDPGAVFA